MQRGIKFLQIRTSNELEYFYTIYLVFIKFQIMSLLEVADLYKSPDLNPWRNIMIKTGLQQYPSNGCTVVGQIQFLLWSSLLEKMRLYTKRDTDLADSYCCHCSRDGIESRVSYIAFGLWQIISVEDGKKTVERHSFVSLKICLILEGGNIGFFPWGNQHKSKCK